MNIGLQKAGSWVDKKLSHPGISDEKLVLRKAYWKASLVCAIVIIILTVTFKLLNHDLKILFIYGSLLGFLFLEWVVELLIFHYNIEMRMFINQLIITLLSFGAILMLGGIPTSGGLIFVGFFVVLFSLDFKKRIYSRWLFIIYVLTLILAGVLQPWLNVPPEMTQGVNISLYVINLLWISTLSFLFVLHFIKERVKIEQREAVRLKEMDQVKTRLYSNITHEFRTPLAIILGMAGLIREKPGEWIDKGTRKIEDHGRVLLHQVNQMLDLTKLESKSMSLHLQSGNVIVLIGQTVEMFRSVADEKTITLSYLPSLDHYVMDHDPEKIVQLVSNLLSNALKYTHEGGAVEVHAEPSPADDLFELRVKDNGPGIPEDALPQIFDRFYRVDEGTEHFIEGSGLGLALCRELVSLLGGEISAESVQGKGALFCISLPVTRNAPFQEESGMANMGEKISILLARHRFPDRKDEHAPGPEEEVRSVSASLLIVEDNQDVIDYLRVIVDPYYNVITAPDGFSGYDAALNHIPDIILTDVMMPGMDGIQLLEKLKGDMRTSHIPVVVLSARADIESRLQGLERGAEAYLAKPFNRDELLIRLSKLVDLRWKLHLRYSGKAWQKPQEEKEYQLEDEFIRKVQQAMERNLDNDEFNVLQLSEEVSMSRSQLYRKFNTLTNLTVGEYLRTFRLKRAREMLETGQANVSEAAFRTGFRNLSHFSRVFTREFGQNPREIQQASKLHI